MQETEIEFKNLLTKSEYHQIDDELFKHVDEISQTNYYIDTNTLDIRNNYLMLRAREKEGEQILTLKVPTEQNVVEEFHNTLNEPVSIGQKISKDILGTTILVIIRRHAINRPLYVQGMLTTIRKERKYESGMLVLDYSTYLNREDFEIEFEATDIEAGRHTFQSLLKNFNIPERSEIVKSERFYRQLEKEKSEN